MSTTITLIHPKGGVGRTLSCYMLGAELALRGHEVALIDRDQGQHLSRLWSVYPLSIPGLALGDNPAADIRLIDTAPEVDASRAVTYLREADWAIVLVKPEAGSILALPILMTWLDQVPSVRLMGFVSTMYHARRAEARQWLQELHRLAAERDVPVFPCIANLASLASYRLDG
ncbi:MAG TPA: ParA family protein, partial [Chloroflexota bacterium]